jgi:glycosyltransferase involved in cell wall biosynthesis
VARRGLAGAASIVALSEHSAGTVAEDFPDLAGMTLSLPGGVDTDLFRPDALDVDVTKRLVGGLGRGPEQTRRLRGILDGFPKDGDAEELARELKGVSASYDPRRHDADAGERLRALMEAGDPLVVYVGKFIHSKGVHCLLQGFGRVHRETGARLLLIGYGTFREALEALTHALSDGNRHILDFLAGNGRLFENGPASPMEQFALSEEVLRDSAGMEEFVEFAGPLYHAELARVLPAADVAVVPSIFPETFGLVAAEAGASGAPPFVADHSGLKEAGAYVGRGLPFDVRVSLEGEFGENLADALIRYLRLPEEERRRCRDVVRRNSVEDLSWGALAGRIAKLAGGKEG